MTKEKIKQICRIYDNFRAERDAATIAYNSDDVFWEHILVTYNLSRPSLPSNLDDAAEEEYPDFSNDIKIYECAKADSVELLPIFKKKELESNIFNDIIKNESINRNRNN